MTIPTVSINQVQPYYGQGCVSAKPNAHYLKVWAGWDSPIVNRMISVSGRECRQLESFTDGNQKTSFFLVMGDGSQTQWEIWAPSPLLFVEGLSKRSIAEAAAWIGYAETGHRDGMSEEQLDRCFREDCNEIKWQAFSMSLDLEYAPRLSTSEDYSSGLRGFKTREEFEAYVESCRTKESTGSYSTFKKIVYSCGDLEVLDFVYDRAGMTQVIYATEEEFKSAIVIAFSPIVDRINTAIDKLESLVRSGESNSAIQSSIAISSYGSDSYHLSLPIGASGQISIKRHRGEISSVVRFGGVSMLQGKSV